MEYEDDDMSKVDRPPDGLLKAAERGKLVLFIGNGVSRLIGLPSWPDLASMLVKDLYKRKKIKPEVKDYYLELSETDPRKVMQFCKRDSDFGEKLTEILTANENSDEFKRNGHIYNELIAFNVNYVTTNWDIYLDKAKQASLLATSPSHTDNIDANTIDDSIEMFRIYPFDDQPSVARMIDGIPQHIHGSIIKGDCVASTMDYFITYSDESKVRPFLKVLFDNFTVLFIGYGLEEEEILKSLALRSNSIDYKKWHYRLYPMYRSEKPIFQVEQYFFNEMGIELIPYFRDFEDYEALTNIIVEWAKIFGKIVKPLGCIEKANLIEEVIK